MASAITGLGIPTTGGTLTGTLSFSGSGALQSATPIKLGSGTAVGTLGGTYAKFVSGAGVGNGADATNDAVWSLTAIPANTFTANGDSLVLTLSYAAAANANTKRWGVNVAGVDYATVSTATNGSQFIGIVTITRVDATHINVLLASAAGPTATTAAAGLNVVVSDLTANTLAVIATAASSASAANDVKLYSGVAEFKK